MSTATTPVHADRAGLIVSCPSCGQKNRLAYRQLDRAQRCAKCHHDLPRPSTPIDLPTVDAFDNLIAGAPLPVLVDFWAEWCGPCRRVAPEMARVAAQRAGALVVAKVDTEALPELAERFRIRSIPMMSVFVAGREAGTTVGVRPAQDILAFVDDAVRRAAS